LSLSLMSRSIELPRPSRAKADTLSKLRGRTIVHRD
jgi:hypothetical protein